MGANGSKEKLTRSASERYVHAQVIERERFGTFGKRTKRGKINVDAPQTHTCFSSVNPSSTV